MINVNELVRLTGARHSGRGFVGHCPNTEGHAHEDRHKSLSIGIGEDGRILLKCHTGCSVEEIVAALGIRIGDLFPRRIGVPPQSEPEQAVSYDYTDENGKLLYQVVRSPGKQFRQRRPDGNGGWIWNLKGVKRVPYNFPAVLAADVVFIAEGEQDCDTLLDLHLECYKPFQSRKIATSCNSGGAGKWDPAYGELFKDKDVTVFEDNDFPGHKHALDVLRSVRPHARTLKLILLPGLPTKGDVTDWKRDHSVIELLAEIERAPLWHPEPNGVLQDESSRPSSQAPSTDAPNAAGEWPDPEPLQSALPDVAQFDVELMPQSFRPLVVDVAERMQVPLDFPAAAAIVTLAGVTNRRARIQPKLNDDSWSLPGNIFGAIVAAPGQLKSPLIAAVTQPVHAIEGEWRKQFRSDEQTYNEGVALQQLEDKAWKKQYETAVLKNAKRPPRPKSDLPLVKPVCRRLTTADATFEALHALMAENPAGIFVLRDELTGLLAGLEKEGREQERAFLLECWNGDGSFTIDRITRGSVYVPHCCVSLLGGIQPARYRQYCADALKNGYSDDGLMQRIQLIVWPDLPDEWRHVDRAPNKIALKHAEDVCRRLAALDPANPLRLKFDPEAQELFVHFLTDLEQRIRGDELPPPLQAHLAKYRSLMPKLGLLFSLANGRVESVPMAETRQACDFCDYLWTHAKRVYAARISAEREAAISLSKKLKKGWKREDGAFTVRDVYRNCWHMLDTPEKARAALLVLQEYAWVRETDEQGIPSGPGRPSETYQINPKIYSLEKRHAGK